MKKYLQHLGSLIKITAFAAITCLGFAAEGKATTVVITVGNSSGGLVFSPATASVTVGDTVKWTWASGNHTSTSLSVPTGAASWDAPVSSSSTTFSYVVTKAGTYNYKCTPHGTCCGMTGSFTATALSTPQDGKVSPSTFALLQNYPNPFNPSTTIGFTLGSQAAVKLTVYNLLGEEVKTLLSELKPAGTYTAVWDATNNAHQPVSTGLYVYRLTAGTFAETRKMILVK